ncbi:hypothetical protein H0V99_03140 [Candidatus Saccharibacteria bacterium]|nr:hypothetical protein [Candidatus Saccharibacteria bacterium]
MRNRRKRKQREEVRKILAAMRQELAEQRLAQAYQASSQPVLYLNELITHARQSL